MFVRSEVLSTVDVDTASIDDARTRLAGPRRERTQRQLNLLPNSFARLINREIPDIAQLLRAIRASY